MILTIDIAHPPVSQEMAERVLLDSWQKVRNSSSLRILKVVHGYGSSGKGGFTREVVRNWVFRNKSRFREVLDGSEYSLFDRRVQSMTREIGDIADPDLGRNNPGITIIWVK
jgi:hypothetical protein